MPEQPAARHGKTAHYSWVESPYQLEVRVPLPVGTKRTQLSIALRDEASGATLWRNEIETAGGEERDRHVERARLRVHPAFWPEPLIDGHLRGALDAVESSYELVATGGGDAWDCLVVSLRKAEEAVGWWGGVVLGDDASATHFERLCRGGAVPGCRQALDDAVGGTGVAAASIVGQ